MHFLVRSINRFFEYTSAFNLNLSNLEGIWRGFELVLSYRPTVSPTKMDFLEIKPEKPKRIHQKETGHVCFCWFELLVNWMVVLRSRWKWNLFIFESRSNFGSKLTIESEFWHCPFENVASIILVNMLKSEREIYPASNPNRNPRVSDTIRDYFFYWSLNRYKNI